MKISDIPRKKLLKEKTRNQWEKPKVVEEKKKRKNKKKNGRGEGRGWLRGLGGEREAVNV